MKSLKTLIFLMALTIGGSVLASEVDINTMDAATIAAGLKGIGMSKAKAIVAYREAHGPFESVEDLSNVRGIGMKTIAKNRDNISLSAGEVPAE